MSSTITMYSDYIEELHSAHCSTMLINDDDNYCAMV